MAENPYQSPETREPPQPSRGVALIVIQSLITGALIWLFIALVEVAIFSP